MAKTKRLSDAEILAQIPAARARERAERRAGLRAQRASYNRKRNMLEIELTNDTLFSIRPRALPALRQLERNQLAQVRLNTSGDALEWDAFDIQVSIPGLLMASFSRGELLSELARVAGGARSKAKALAAQRNGAKGGRPRKNTGARRSRTKTRHAVTELTALSAQIAKRTKNNKPLTAVDVRAAVEYGRS